MGKLYYDISFKNSYFEKVSFIKAVLNFNDFQYSKFIDTEFRGADLRESNLCGAKLYQTSYFDTDFSYTNLIGVDLSNIIVLPHTIESVVHLENAYYNSQTIKMTSEFKIFNFLALHFPTCIDFTIEGFPPTKFPQGFDPEIYGMIDMSKPKNLLKPFNTGN
ncbi:pentapeptide repeat-containing protein [Rickettsia endosymbiont of Lasioglossum villosulum]|uniref:pentapeptide repeat-containing protein n=1 Tax=Rickettsia endosymbiont of Lasioglossum villosulum TaxID=3066269 RepID=UPI003132BCA7